MEADTADLDAQIAKLQEEKRRKLAIAERARLENEKEEAKVLVGLTPTKRKEKLGGELGDAQHWQKLISRNFHGNDTNKTCAAQFHKQTTGTTSIEAQASSTVRPVDFCPAWKIEPFNITGFAP